MKVLSASQSVLTIDVDVDDLLYIYCPQKSLHIGLAITGMHGLIWIFLGRNVTGKVSNQNVLYFLTLSS